MQIGSLWNGWKIESLIGEGSFGKVYKIVKEELGYEYDSALKVIHIPQSQSEVASIKNQGMNDESVTMYFKSMVEELVSEFALMSKFKGTSNIVSYEDHVIEEKKDSFGWTIYIRMELLTPMYDYLRKNKLSVRDVIKLGIDICQALELCQKYNIIHRDIKPENIFVSRFGDFKLGDFGIARQLEKTSSGMSKKGTYTYMAPEVYKGMPYNSTVDIYSLGIVLYSFLNNNRTPFLPPYPQTIKYTDKEKANVLRMSGKELPMPQNAKGRLAEIVLKACAYNPSDRYESAYEMRKALETVLYDKSEAELIYPNGNNILEKDSFSPKDDTIKDIDDNVVPVTNEKTAYLFREQAEKAAREEAARKAREEAERKARLEAEERARKAAEERARREAEAKARREAAEKARKEAEERARREAEEKARREAEERAQREAEEKARRQAEKQARIRAAEIARKQEEEQARRAAEEKEKKEAAERAKREAAEEARREARERAKRKAEEKARQKEESARLKAEKREAKNNKQGERQSKKKIIIICGALLAVIIGIIITVVSCNSAKFTIVPNVIGDTKQQAIKELDEAELKHSLSYEFSNTMSEGRVIRQNKTANTKIEKGSTVVLTISKGRKLIVPDLVGKTEKEARSLLKKNNLKLLVEKKKYSDSIKKGKIISQSTKAGTVIGSGDTIAVIVSKGVEMISVPSVVGLSKENAKTKLSKSKLKYEIAYDYSGNVSKGKVIKQSIESGKKVKKNTIIYLTVSKGKKPVSNNTSSSTNNYNNNNNNNSYVETQATEEVQTPETQETTPEPESEESIIGWVEGE